MTTTATDIDTIIERTRERPPQKCHFVDKRGRAICGAFGPGPGERDTSNLHPRSECRARGHKRCVACEELDRQLGDDFMVA